MPTTTTSPDAYVAAGVNYDFIDPLKVRAQQVAATTGAQLAAHGFAEVKESRGESAYVVDVGPFYVASVVECLGTKAIVADVMAGLGRESHYEKIARDTIATGVNDLITVGAAPCVVQAYWAAGSSDWFLDEARYEALIEGWRRACVECGASWGGGETPALGGVVEGARVDLAASCWEVVNPKARLILGEKLGPGDVIVLLESGGIHANGLSLARQIVQGLSPHGWLTQLDDGRAYIEALLDPTVLYARVMEKLWERGIVPHYCANITGHGWLKLMRHPAGLTYYIKNLPPVPPVLSFIQREAGMSDEEAYRTLNMGAGFALFVKSSDAPAVATAANSVGVGACIAGWVDEGPRQVLIKPLDVTYTHLGIR